MFSWQYTSPQRWRRQGPLKMLVSHNYSTGCCNSEDLNLRPHPGPRNFIWNIFWNGEYLTKYKPKEVLTLDSEWHCNNTFVSVTLTECPFFFWLRATLRDCTLYQQSVLRKWIIHWYFINGIRWGFITSYAAYCVWHNKWPVVRIKVCSLILEFTSTCPACHGCFWTKHYKRQNWLFW